MSASIPQLVRCGGFLGCGARLDLGEELELRGPRLIDHLREHPGHQETALPRLLLNVVLTPA